MSDATAPSTLSIAALDQLDARRQALLAALALGDRCPPAVLAALLACPPGGWLAAGGWADWRDGSWAPRDPAGLAAALAERPALARAGHGVLAEALAAALAPGASVAAPERDGLEEAYLHYFQLYCEATLQQQPTALAAAAAAPPAGLGPAGARLAAYYRGLGEGLLERFDAAQAIFAGLLADPALDELIRARTLNSSAGFAQHQGAYELARDRYRASLAIWERLDNQLRQGVTLNNLGVLEYELRDYAAAEACFQASARLFAASGATYHRGLACNELGLLARDQGRWAEAETHLAEAAAIFEREGAVDFLGHVFNNLGEVALLSGQWALAESWLERAAATMQTRVYGVDIALNQGLLRQALGDHEAALERYAAALELARAAERRDVLAWIYARLADAAARLGRFDEARARYAEALAHVEDTRAPLRDEGLLIKLMGRWQQVYEAAVLLCAERGDWAAAFDWAEQARARAFADLIRQRQADDAAQPPIGAAALQAALAAGESADAVLVFAATGLRGPESALLEAMPPAAAALRACLEVPARLLCWSVTGARLRGRICPIDPNLFQAPSLFNADGRRFLAPAVLRRAGAALLGAAPAELAGADRWWIVPHGPLHQLPFAAVAAGAGALLDAPAALCYAPSATVLVHLLGLAPSAAPRPCLAIGYDGAAGLRHTQPEALAVAALWGGDAWLAAPGADRRFAAEARRYRCLHLACHGEFDLGDPLQSWLELGPGARLTAAAILEGGALDADLVTLSACRSGLSKLLRGDEPLGFVRALLRAGARAVLVTLWEVEDTASRLLMERFYRQLLAGAGPARALQTAQRAVRDLTNRELRAALAEWDDPQAAQVPADDRRPFADPLFWAAYALIGGATSSLMPATSA